MTIYTDVCDALIGWCIGTGITEHKKSQKEIDLCIETAIDKLNMARQQAILRASCVVSKGSVDA